MINYFKAVGTFWITAIPMILRFINAPAGRMAEQSQNVAWPNAIPDIFTLVEFFNKGIITYEEYSSACRKNGFDESWALSLYQANEQKLTAIDYIQAFRRGIITEDILQLSLDRLKLSAYDQQVLIRASEYFPTPADLVTFAVREVYSPEIVKRFGQDQDLPEKFLEEAEKAGLPKEQATNYWSAHWDLPSISQGFEMYHRGVIEEKDLDILLRALDVMPFWREGLKKIAYNPLTRVDVRRMYSVGVLDREGVKRSYLDIGYDDKNAELMTEFTIRYENDAMEGLTRATVIDAYKDQLIDRDTLINYLIGFNYTDEVVAFWVNQADYELTMSRMNVLKSSLITRYKEGSISESEMQQRLLNEGLPATYIEQVISDAVIAKSERTKVPSINDLENWLRRGYIDEQYYVQKMRLLGFPDSDIEIYLTVISADMDTSKRKYLPVETYQRWYTANIISKDTFINILSAMGINNEDIMSMLGEIEGGKLESTI